MSFVWLPDGAPLLLRPIRAADIARLETAWQRSSRESQRQRMHGTTGPLSRRALTDLTRIDHHSHEAIVAIDLADDAIVGIMRYIRIPGRRADAELAALVVDDWQRRGVATALMTELSRRAEAEGIQRYVAYVTGCKRGSISAPSRHSRRPHSALDCKMRCPVWTCLRSGTGWSQVGGAPVVVATGGDPADDSYPDR